MDKIKPQVKDDEDHVAMDEFISAVQLFYQYKNVAWKCLSTRDFYGYYWKVISVYETLQ